jgi:hypothetical protein
VVHTKVKGVVYYRVLRGVSREQPRAEILRDLSTWRGSDFHFPPWNVDRDVLGLQSFMSQLAA